ncbi:apextrin-like protein 1 [Elysia marginata]|uniref:Apextrin-like protein 1 n=1 Tax=Elysia marginata TaxID=1093978 RepID=A0AAV4HV08_9GAST|nr:apextrin-like protein 1 [Elysia marginata]
MGWYEVTIVACLLVVHQGLSLPISDVSDPEMPFQLIVTPPLVNTYVFENMKMRCERNPNVQTKLTEIFRIRIVKLSNSDWNLVAEERDVAASSKVTGNVTVVANIRDDISRDFLQVSWNHIDDDSFGIFKCDVIGFDNHSNVVMEHSPQIKVSDVKNFRDLMKSFIQKVQGGFLHLRITMDSELGRHEDRLTKLERFVSGLTQWPGGHYALPRPRTGCPVDLAFFGGTHSYMKLHTESQSFSDPRNNHTSAFPLWTTFESDSKNFVTLEFCEATREFNTASWPLGSFCINRIYPESCPVGFTDGFAPFNAETTESSSEMRTHAGGIGYILFPMLFFCCQNSTYATDPIELPTDSSFFLYRYGGVCQAVQGMSVSEEYIMINTEDSTYLQNFHGSLPDIDLLGDSLLKLNLCYYTKL